MGVPIIITCNVIVWYSTTTPGCRDGKGIEHSRVYVYNTFSNGITQYVVMIKAIIPYFPFSCTDDKPSLLNLKKFPGKDHTCTEDVSVSGELSDQQKVWFSPPERLSTEGEEFKYFAVTLGPCLVHVFLVSCTCSCTSKRNHTHIPTHTHTQLQHPREVG